MALNFRKLLVTTAALSATLLVIISVLMLVSRNGANTAALPEKTTALAQGEGKLTTDLEGSEKSLVSVGDGSPANGPQMEPLRKSVLENERQNTPEANSKATAANASDSTALSRRAAEPT